MAQRRRGRQQKKPAVAELVRELGGLLSEFMLAEIDVTIDNTRIRLTRREASAMSSASPQASPALTAAPLVVEVQSPPGVTIEAPMVGTFYRAPSPDAEPYVREGDLVKEGQILCIIEAMKLMNEIESKTSGRIMRILVDNGHGVEYGQALFLIEPSR